MSPRRYDRRLREAASEEARRRIVEAAAGLHAKQGALGTSHAQIARDAGVSIPTVYKYFPTRDDLVPACTGLVASRAPLHFDEKLFDGVRQLPERVGILARSLFRLHEHFAPWMRWADADAAAIPVLQGWLETARKGRLELVRLALTPPGSRPPAESVVLLAHVLLEYPSWRTLTAARKSSESASVIVTDAILKLLKQDRP